MIRRALTALVGVAVVASAMTVTGHGPRPEFQAAQAEPSVTATAVVVDDERVGAAAIEAVDVAGEAPMVSVDRFDGIRSSRSLSEFGPDPYADVVPSSGPWVVTVGIDDYAGAGADLRYSNNDADDMDLAMARLGVPGSRRLALRDREASGSAIVQAARWAAANADTDSTLVFMYAGHVRLRSGGVHELVGADGLTVPDHILAEVLSTTRARRVWVVVAGCYGAGFDEVVRDGVVLTAAAPADRLAYENSAFQRSYLGEYLIRRGLLAGEGGASVESAFAWAHRQLAADRPDRLPVQIDRLAGDLDFASIAGRRSATASTPTTTTPRRDPSPTSTPEQPSDPDSAQRTPLSLPTL